LQRILQATALANDCFAHSKRLDWAEICRRQASRRNMARSSGAGHRSGTQTGTRDGSRTVDEELQTGRAVGRGREAHSRTCGTVAKRGAAHGVEPTREARPGTDRSLDGPLPELCRLRNEEGW